MALYYNVSQLLKDDVGQTREYEFQGDEPVDLEDGVASNVSGRVRFILTNFGIIARVSARATLHLTCARCLDPFQMPASVEFDEEYRPTIDIATGLPSRLPRSDASSFISQSHDIDLGEAIRQNLVLAMDLIPLCRDDCRGLCPTCGVNRNLEECRCTPVEESSPFAVLQTLLSNDKPG
jgi:uncharacterized protein